SAEAPLILQCIVCHDREAGRCSLGDGLAGGFLRDGWQWRGGPAAVGRDRALIDNRSNNGAAAGQSRVWGDDQSVGEGMSAAQQLEGGWTCAITYDKWKRIANGCVSRGECATIE